MLAGLWSGFKLYGTIDDETFRKAVLILLLFAGLSLIVPALILRGPLIRDLREYSRRTSFTALGEMQTPQQTVSVQALRNTRSSRRLRVDEARTIFFFPVTRLYSAIARAAP